MFEIKYNSFLHLHAVSTVFLLELEMLEIYIVLALGGPPPRFPCHVYHLKDDSYHVWLESNHGFRSR